MANCNLSCMILLGGLSVNLNHLTTKSANFPPSSCKEILLLGGNPSKYCNMVSTLQPHRTGHYHLWDFIYHSVNKFLQ